MATLPYIRPIHQFIHSWSLCIYSGVIYLLSIHVLCVHWKEMTFALCNSPRFTNPANWPKSGIIWFFTFNSKHYFLPLSILFRYFYVRFCYKSLCSVFTPDLITCFWSLIKGFIFRTAGQMCNIHCRLPQQYI